MNDAPRDPLHGPVIDDIPDILNDLTINDAEYYVSNSAISNDAKVNFESNHKTGNHTSSGKVKVVDTSNGSFQQKLFSNRTLPVIVPTMNPRIENMIAPIGGSSQTLFTPVTKKVVADAECSGT